nr:transposase [Dickeya fangzhongdai]
MRKARFTEHSIITILKSAEAGRTIKDVCREAGIPKSNDSIINAYFTNQE